MPLDSNTITPEDISALKGEPLKFQNEEYDWVDAYVVQSDINTGMSVMGPGIYHDPDEDHIILWCLNFDTLNINEIHKQYDYMHEYLSSMVRGTEPWGSSVGGGNADHMAAACAFS